LPFTGVIVVDELCTIEFFMDFLFFVLFFFKSGLLSVEVRPYVGPYIRVHYTIVLTPAEAWRAMAVGIYGE